MSSPSVSEAVAEGFAKHRSFDSCYCDAADADVLMHHLGRLEQAYLSRLPPALRADSSLSFGLAYGRGVALERIANLFDSKWRKQCLPPESAKAIFRALAGPNPQGMCWKGWRLSGFGETQVSGARPTIVHAEKIVAAFQRMWGCPVDVEALPLTILKPPGGSRLEAHIDSGSMLEAYVACRELLAAGRASPLDWAREHGCQALIHWEGARPNRAAAKDGAHTCGLSRLTTARYFVFLSMFHPEHTHAAIPPPKTVDARAASAAAKSSDPHALQVETAAELTLLMTRVGDATVARFVAKGGPVFAPFFEAPVLAALSEALAFLEDGRAPPAKGATQAWLDVLGRAGRLDALKTACFTHREAQLGAVVPAPMCPTPSADFERSHAPICLSWLRGWPHMAKEGGMRLTFVPGLQPRPKASARGLAALATFEEERERTVRRALLMLRGDYSTIRADVKLSRPVAGGSTHSHPEQEEQMHRDYDRRVYATIAELEAFDRYTKQLNVAAIAAISAELGEAGGRGEGGVGRAGALTSTGNDGSAHIESHGTFGAAALVPSLGGGRPAAPLLEGKKEKKKKKRARVEDDGLGRNGTVRSCVGDRHWLLRSKPLLAGWNFGTGATRNSAC